MALHCQQHHNKVCTCTIRMHTMQHKTELSVNRPDTEIGISCVSNELAWLLWRGENGEIESNIKILKESFDNSGYRWPRVPSFPLAGPPLLQNEGFAHWQTPTPVLSPRWMLLCSTQRPVPLPKLPSAVWTRPLHSVVHLWNPQFGWVSRGCQVRVVGFFYPGLFVLLVSR